MGFLIEALSTNPGFIISDPFLIQGIAREIRWGEGGSFFNIGLRLVRIFRKTMGQYGYSANTIRKAILTIKGGYPKNIIFAKALGLRANTGLIKEVHSLYKDFPSFWMVDLPLLLIPNIFYRVAYRAYRIKAFNKVCRGLLGKIPG
jgi:hypothetical protein